MMMTCVKIRDIGGDEVILNKEAFVLACKSPSNKEIIHVYLIGVNTPLAITREQYNNHLAFSFGGDRLN